jgi:hypothetical protein
MEPPEEIDLEHRPVPCAFGDVEVKREYSVPAVDH